MMKLYEAKNNDYGDSVSDTYNKFGMDAFTVRMYDKLNRIYSLTRSDMKGKVLDEKIEDTLLDLANYAVLALVELEVYKDSLCKCCAEDVSREEKDIQILLEGEPHGKRYKEEN